MTPAIIRFMKIYTGYHGPPYTKHPFIRLSGKYLAKMGFTIGEKITVTVEHQRITITKQPLELIPCETEAGSAGAQPVEG